MPTNQQSLFQASDGARKPRQLPHGCQVERPFDDDEWRTFVACARRVWESGEFLHDNFDEHVQFHPEATWERIREAICEEAALVAYQADGMERVTLFDYCGTGLVIVATLQDGIITAYEADDFAGSVDRTKRSVRWLREMI